MSKPYFSRFLHSLIPAIFLTIFSFQFVNAQDGEALFNANCKACHAVKEKVVGPALEGVETRHDHAWLLKWIKNSQAVIKSGDEKAIKLFNDNNKVAMPPFNLKDAEIDAILAYVKKESEKQETPAGGAPTAVAPVKEQSKPIWPYLLIAAVVLIIISGILRSVQLTLQKTVRAKNNIPEPPAMTRKARTLYWIRNNKKLIAVIIVLLVVWGNVKGWYTLMSIGVSQGYTPDQPIAYSHMLHAGKLQIQCIYCHSGAEKGKTAGIPSANVCMNCHKFVKKGPTTGTEEIAKIYKALDYDPSTGTYGPNQHPIHWTRVHNLPDLAYFNHSQHVVVGKVACQTCHGPVQDSMTVISQYSPLTMGWCIDCHRRTPVKMEGNAYYTDFHKTLMERMPGDTVFTVKDIGGLECSRCHY